MQKWSICKLAAILIFSILASGCRQDISLIRTTYLKTFPSASAIEYYNNHLYIIGDDATKILVTDAEHNIVDSISVFDSKLNRISKNEKADLEASILINNGDNPFLLAFSSFSTARRNKLAMLDLQNKKVTITDEDLSGLPIKELNIEGAAIVCDKLLLANRANNTHRINRLIVTSRDIQNRIQQKGVKIIDIIFPASKVVIGISGLAYLKEKDILLFTASTENTANAYTDGPIGDSYVGIIKRVSGLLGQIEIKVDKLIALSPYMANGKPQKIESIAVEELKGNSITFHLVADNDNGESTLFKMSASLE